MCEIELNSEQFSALARQLLSSEHHIRFRAHGFSMRPFICDGEFLEVQALRGRSIHRGDILLFDMFGRVVVHRVVDCWIQDGECHLLPQGDALLAPDGAIDSRQAWGRVAWVEKRGRRISTDAWWWRGTSWCWMRLAPLRSLLFRLVAGLKTGWRRMR